MTDVPNPPERAPWVETEESLNARRVTSLFGNRVHVLVNGGVARITIGEIVQSGETNWHTSFSMVAFDAVQLAELIITQDNWDRRQMNAPPAPADVGTTDG